MAKKLFTIKEMKELRKRIDAKCKDEEIRWANGKKPHGINIQKIAGQIAHDINNLGMLFDKDFIDNWDYIDADTRKWIIFGIEYFIKNIHYLKKMREENKPKQLMGRG